MAIIYQLSMLLGLRDRLEAREAVTIVCHLVTIESAFAGTRHRLWHCCDLKGNLSGLVNTNSSQVGV